MERMKMKKGNLALYLGLLVIVVLIMVLLRTCSREDIYPAKQIGNSGGDTIDVAIVYSPMNYYMYGDTLGGFNYDLLRLIAERDSLKFRYWPIVGLDEAIAKLENRTYDVLVSLPIDNELKQRFAYTSNVALDRQVLVQRRLKDGRLAVTSSLELAGDTLHIEKNSPVGFRISNLMREIGDTIYVVEHENLSSEYLFLKVASGAFKYAVVNDRVVKPLLEKYPDVSLDTPISFTQFQAWMVNKEDTLLLNRLNSLIEEVKATAEYADLKCRYGL